jgi:hypothetical protein
MKQSALIKHIKRNGCELLREGARHTVFLIQSIAVHHLCHTMSKSRIFLHARSVVIC